jgi:hypothetical protein
VSRCWRTLVAALFGASMLAGSSALAQPAAFTIRGTIRSTADATPVIGAVIELHGARLQRQSRSDEVGKFTIGAVPTGSYTLSVLRLGYEPLSQTVAVGDSDADLTISIRPDTLQQLGTIITRANVTAIYGGIGAVGGTRNARGEKELTAVRDARLQVMGSGKSVTTDSIGRFFLELRKPGLYIIRVTSPGLATQMFPVDVPRNRALEVSRMMDSARATPPTGREYLFNDMDRRLRLRTMNSALVPGSQLRETGGALSDALQRTPAMNVRGLRLGPTTCVFVDGVPRPGSPLDAYAVEDIEAVELYDDNSDLTGTVSKAWPRGAQCGLASRLPPPPSNGMGPPIAKYAMIWTRR